MKVEQMYLARCLTGSSHATVYECRDNRDMNGKQVPGIPIQPREHSWTFWSRQNNPHAAIGVRGGCAIHSDPKVAAARAIRWARKWVED